MSLMQRGSAIILTLAVAILIGISVWAFASNVGQGSKDRVSPFAQLMNGNTVSTQAANEIVTNDGRPSLTLEGDELDLAKKTLTGQLRLEIPPGVQGQLFDVNTGKPIFNCNGNEICHLKPQYANDPISIQLITLSSEPGSESEFQRTIPMKAIDQSILSRVVMPISIPMTGFPDLYPQDYYFFDLLMSFNLPSNVQRLINGKAPTGASKDFYSFQPGNVSSSQDTKISPLTDAKRVAQPGEYHISFHRKTQDQLYIYSVALIPLIFAFLFFHLLFFSTHFHHKVFEEFTEALIVAILAVLPLRAVLVPVALEGLTRVDLVLGLGLVLIVAVAVGKYATEIWGSARPWGRDEEETHIRRVHEEPLEELGLEPAAP